MNVFVKSFMAVIVFLNACGEVPTPEKTHDVIANLFFVRSNFEPNKTLEDFDIERHSAAIKNINNAHFKPKLSKQGFVFEDFRQEKQVTNFLDNVKDVYSKNISEDKRYELLKPSLLAFEKHVKGWAAQQQIADAEEVICGRGYYRNTDMAAQILVGAAMHFEFAHFDFFPGQDLGKLFKQIGFNKQLVDRFGGMADRDDFWKKHKLVTMINLWMPLNAVHAYPLAVLDVSTLNSKDVLPFMTVVKGVDGTFTSGAVRYRPKHQFYFKPEMRKGEAIVFESFKTPHTAFRLPGQTGHRESYDIRCAFISKKP